MRDLDAAESWLKQSRDLRPPEDALGRGKCLNQLGEVALQRFRDAMRKWRPEEKSVRLAYDALRYYEESLRLFPPTALVERGVAHNQLGTVYSPSATLIAGCSIISRAFATRTSWRIFRAGETRFNVAIALLEAGRFDDARVYCKAALANFQTFGNGAAKEVQKVEALLADIDKAEADQRGKS